MLVSDLINYSLRLAGILGVGQSPLAQDEQDAQTTLALMMGQWQRRRWVVFRLDAVATSVNPWQAVYRIGPDAPADIPWPGKRPGSIEFAFIRQLTGLAVLGGFPVDYPLRAIRSREEWMAIPLKSLGSWPGQFFYDPTLPNGSIYLWPIPIQAFFELHVSAAQTIADANPDDDLADMLPEETNEALAYNLACRLRVNYRLPADPAMVALAQTSLNTLRTNNFAVRTLRMPPALRRDPRFKNPMGGYYPETNAGIPFPVLA